MSRGITPTLIYYILPILTLLIAFETTASEKGTYYLSGIVRDAVTLEPLPYTSVNVEGEANGTLTTETGKFELTVSDGASSLVINCLGYEKKIMPIAKNRINLYDVHLTPVSTELNEVVVRRKKYSKKNNPAVDFAKSLRASAPLTDPRQQANYNYRKHELINFALNDFGEKKENSMLFKQFPFLWNYVDTSEISGKPILNFMVKEKTSEVHYRKDPRSEKEVVTGIRQEGIDEIGEQENVSAVLEDMLQEIDLYKNDIEILQNRFVSPLSRLAPDFYKFYLTDTVEVGNEKCIVLSFYPHNPSSFGFNGQVFVPVNDSTMFIKKVTMRTPRNINLNFIENMFISQEYERDSTGMRIKKQDDLTIEARIMAGTPGLYVRRNIAFDNHSFDEPADKWMFDEAPKKIVEKEAKSRDEIFWDQQRIIQVTDNEKRMGNLMADLRSVPLYYWAEKVMKIMFQGYIATSPKSKFDIGPVNTMLSFNSTEGTRLRLGGMTTANLNPHVFGRGYVAYGTKDRKWKYGIEAEYSFNKKDYHSREFPIHSIRLTSNYDLDNIGQHYLYTNQDNVFLSLKRMTSHNTTYRHLNKIEYTLELYNNFSVQASIQNEKQEATRYLTFTNGYGTSFSNYTENSASLTLRYAPGEKYVQTKTFRIPINPDAPVFTLTHTIAPKGIGKTMFGINKTEIGFEKRFWLSAFGYIDTEIRGGHVWSRSPFPNLLIPNANLSYTIQQGSYAMMNAMEFINDSYASWDVTYWLNGALFNLIPGFKVLKLREVVTFKGLYGKLSDRNDPSTNPDLFRFPAEANVTKMTNTPYMELSAGLDNIFKILRIDYVWRLTYRDVPYKIDKNGIRISLHARF